MKIFFLVIFMLFALASVSVRASAVRFTGDANLAEWLVESIDRAEVSIKVMVFIFEYEPISDALIRASQRGVDVKVITDVRSVSIESVPVGGGECP